MARRTVPLLLLMVLVAGGALWLFSREGTPEAEPVARRAPEAVEPSASADSLRPADRPQALTSGGAVAEAPSQEEPSSRRRAKAAGPTPADAVIVEGRVVFPPDTPADEELWVVANGRAFEDGTDERRVPVEADGSFRAPFSADTLSGVLSVQGRYLFLRKPAKLRLRQAQDVVLEPELGGLLLVEVETPPGTESQVIGSRARLNSYSPSTKRAHDSAARVSEELEIAFGGVPSQCLYYINFHPDGMAPASLGNPSVSKGEITRVPLVLRLGAIVKGVVADDTGRPVANASISIYVDREDEWQSESMRTDEQGAFTSPGMAAGLGYYDVDARGLVEIDGEVTLTEGEVVDLGILTLSRGNWVTGVVRWPDGTPAVEASVILEGDDEEIEETAVLTDALGEFEIPGLGEGPYSLYASADLPEDPDQAEERRERTGQRSRRAPRWRAYAEGLRPGSKAELILDPGDSVHGRVVDDSGAAVEHFTLEATPEERPGDSTFAGQRLTRTFRSGSGRFVLEGLRAGRWRLEASGRHHGSSPAVVFELPGDPGALTLVVPREAGLTGLVLDPSGAPVRGAEIRVDTPNPAGSGWLAPASRGRRVDSTDREGRFEIEMDPATVAVSAAAEGFARSPWQRVELQAGERQEIVLSLQTPARMTGELLPHLTPLANREVSAVATLADGSHEVESTHTDEEGRFEFPILVPATYTVDVEPDGFLFQNAHEDPAAFGAQDPLSHRVDLGAGESVHVVLGSFPDSAVPVQGLVTEDGEPVPHVIVRAYQEGSGSTRSTQTDAEGRFALVIEEPGEVWFSIGAQWQDAVRFLERVPAEETVELQFELPTARLEGVVLGPDGLPLADVHLTLKRLGEASAASENQLRRVRTGRDGAFSFVRLHPGPHLLRAGGSNPFNLPEAGHRVVGRIARTLAIEEDAIERVELRMEWGGSVVGTVQTPTGAPVERTWVRLFDEANRPLSTAPERLTDAFGKFSIGGLAPGRYTARVERPGGASGSTTFEILAETNVSVEIVVLGG